MRKETYIDLLTVAEGVCEIESDLRALCPNDYNFGEGSGMEKLMKIKDILSDNALPQYNYVANDDDKSEHFRAFEEVMNRKELSTKEKCEILIGSEFVGAGLAARFVTWSLWREHILPELNNIIYSYNIENNSEIKHGIIFYLEELLYEQLIKK